MSDIIFANKQNKLFNYVSNVCNDDNYHDNQWKNNINNIRQKFSKDITNYDNPLLSQMLDNFKVFTSYMGQNYVKSMYLVS